jgi:hypothetical protein
MKRLVFAALVLAGWCGAAQAMPVLVREPVVCDVTPRGFSVAWVTDKAAEPSLTVYDAQGADVTGLFTQTAFPGLSGSEAMGWARSAGMMKARVEGLAPNTVYSFKCKTVFGSETLVWPEGAPVTVRTAGSAEVQDAALAPGANDLFHFQVFRPDMSTPARGSLVLCQAPGAAHPVTAYVGDGSAGDGAEPGYVVLDLNNLYSAATGKTLWLDAGLVLTLRALRGNGAMGDELLHYRKLDPQSHTAALSTPKKGFFADLNCDGAVNLLDAALYTGGWGESQGDARYNPDYDMNGDHVVNQADNGVFTPQYGRSEPFQ